MQFFHGFGDSHAAALDQHFGNVGGGGVSHSLEIHHQVGADFFKGAKAFLIISISVQDVPGFIVKFTVSCKLFFQIRLKLLILRDLQQLLQGIHAHLGILIYIV